jgi:hypothetical protein
MGDALFPFSKCVLSASDSLGDCWSEAVDRLLLGVLGRVRLSGEGVSKVDLFDVCSKIGFERASRLPMLLRPEDAFVS